MRNGEWNDLLLLLSVCIFGGGGGGGLQETLEICSIVDIGDNGNQNVLSQHDLVVWG